MVTRFQAARRHAMIMGAMNEEALDAELQRKREMERRKEQRLRGSRGTSRGQRATDSRSSRRKSLTELGAAAGGEPHSRLGRVMHEFGRGDDWLSRVLLRHALAALIQAHWRGYTLRKRWARNKREVVEEAKRAAAAAAAAASGAARSPGRRGSAGGRQRAHTKVGGAIVSEVLEQQEVEEVRSDESDWSDLEMESLETWKFKASLPPWTKPENCQLLNMYAQMARRGGRVDILRDPTESMHRVEQVRTRRMQRQQQAAAAGAGGVGNSGGGEGGAGESAELGSSMEDPLPAELVHDLLLDRYIEKWTRLGLLQPRQPKQKAEAPEDD